MRSQLRSVPTRVMAVVAAALGMTVALATPAMAAAQVTIPAAYPANGQTITVTGTGFPVHAKDPTGLAIIECADPGGTAAGLPSTAAFCDGSTVNPLQINTDAGGNFTARYVIASLNSAHTSNISCDQTHYCVLWVGVDFNNDFLGAHAFSAPFKVGASGSGPGGGSGFPAIAIWLPLAVVVVLGAAVARSRRGRRGDRLSGAEGSPPLSVG